MDEENFKTYLEKQGKTQNSIKRRLTSLRSIVDLFDIDLDYIIYNRKDVIELLYKIKPVDTKNQNLSNALRHYYTFKTNDTLGKLKQHK